MVKILDRIATWIALVVGCWWGVTLASAAPSWLPYQGHVTVSGRAYEGNGAFKFALLDAANATVWSNDGTSSNGSEPTGALTLTLKRGVFQVSLGDTAVPGMAALPAGLASRAGLKLRVWFQPSGGSFELLAPDRPIGAVPYALRAEAAGTVESVPEGVLEERHLPSSLVQRLADVRSDLTAATNALGDRLVATNAALPVRLTSLEARVDGLERGLAAVSNLLHAPFNPFTPVLAIDPAEPSLVSQGYEVFLTFPAPGWTNLASANAPGARYSHTAVWTGTDWVIWGGNFSPTSFGNSGARYTPEFDQWTALSPLNAPSARGGHAAVWTGTEMIIWGGSDTAGFLSTGARFEAAGLRWLSLATSGAPGARDGHIAIWTGSRMVVWGGQDANGLLGTGGIYNPANNSWAALNLPNAPAPRVGATAVWAGDRILVWGGEGESGPLDSGAQLLCDGSGLPTAWVAMSATGAPSARSGHSGVWNTAGLMIWGGQQNGVFLNDGAIFDPVHNSWEAISPMGAPTARAWHCAVWAGKEMVITGGEGPSGTLATSAGYDTSTGRWRSIPGSGQPQSRSSATALHLGTDVLVFGGRSAGKAVAALQRLSLQPAWYLFRKP